MYHKKTIISLLKLKSRIRYKSKDLIYLYLMVDHIGMMKHLWVMVMVAVMVISMSMCMCMCVCVCMCIHGISINVSVVVIEIAGNTGPVLFQLQNTKTTMWRRIAVVVLVRVSGIRIRISIAICMLFFSHSIVRICFGHRLFVVVVFVVVIVLVLVMQVGMLLVAPIVVCDNP